MLKDLSKIVIETFGGSPEVREAAARLKTQYAPPGKGDIAVNVNVIAKSLNRKVPEVAQSLADALSRHPLLATVVVDGSYVNMRLVPQVLFRAALDAIEPGFVQVATPERIMVEYLSPNTNKPLHLGHVRNGVLGTSLANILEEAGHEVIRANLVNDRGVHICKSMLGYLEFFPGRTPESEGKKGDHFVGDCYVAYMKARKADPSYDEDNDVAAKRMLEQWEAGDEEVLRLWRLMNGWVYEGFAATNERYGFKFVANYYESDLYRLGKDIVYDGLARGVLTKLPDGSIVFRLPEEKYGRDQQDRERMAGLLRPEGTSLYLTQDLGTAVRKVEDFDLDRSIYVVATEQDHHFKALFEVLKALGYPWANHCYHFSYGMVELPDGRMKSREGNVVDADDLLDEMTKLAESAITERWGSKLQPKEIALRANAIALAAIRLYLLRYGPQKKVLFNPGQSIAFEGDTGPYCLYAYARTSSIIGKAQRERPDLFDTEATLALEKLGTDDERMLARLLLEFAESIKKAAETYNPSLVANAVLALAHGFNRFYRTHPVIGEDQELSAGRLVLTQAVNASLKRGLGLLGIETLEEM